MAFGFQQTFQTPLKDLERFTDVIISALPRTETAQVIIDQVVFEPRYELPGLFAKHSLPQQWSGVDRTVEAQGAMEARELLRAALSEWIDFLFVPTPRPFVIYADHDEYITFLAHRKGKLSGVVTALSAAHFRPVDYVRKL
jgi:hypothetical protein